MSLGTALMLGVLLAFNSATTGSPLVFGYQVLWGRAHDPGFGHSGWGEPHTPLLGLLHTFDNLLALNQYLFEWPFPSLLFVVVLVRFGWPLGRCRLRSLRPGAAGRSAVGVRAEAARAACARVRQAAVCVDRRLQPARAGRASGTA